MCRVLFLPFLSLHFHLMSVASTSQASFLLADISELYKGSWCKPACCTFVLLKIQVLWSSPSFNFLPWAWGQLKSRLVRVGPRRYVREFSLILSKAAPSAPVEFVGNLNVPLTPHFTSLNLPWLIGLFSGQRKSFIFLLKGRMVSQLSKGLRKPGAKAESPL